MAASGRRGRFWDADPDSDNEKEATPAAGDAESTAGTETKAAGRVTFARGDDDSDSDDHRVKGAKQKQVEQLQVRTLVPVMPHERPSPRPVCRGAKPGKPARSPLTKTHRGKGPPFKTRAARPGPTRRLRNSAGVPAAGSERQRDASPGTGPLGSGAAVRVGGGRAGPDILVSSKGRAAPLASGLGPARGKQSWEGCGHPVRANAPPPGSRLAVPLWRAKLASGTGEVGGKEAAAAWLPACSRQPAPPPPRRSCVCCVAPCLVR